MSAGASIPGAAGQGAETPGEFAFAIIGAGVSGLCLAWQILHSPLADQPILLIDGARDDDALRTLSFWAREPTPFEPLVKARFRELDVRDDTGATIPVRLSEHAYTTLFFADLQRLVKAALTRDPRHRVVDARAQAVEDRGDHVEIRAGERAYRARYAFDSRFHLARLTVDERRYHALHQHFRGLLVRSREPVFEPKAAVFMDFRSKLPRGRAFFYVLPLDRQTALVELVTLDPVDAELEIARYLREELGVERYEVLDREAGISPMTEQPFAVRPSERVRAIGIPAGRLKPSTGYAFTRILDESRAIVESLLRHGHPFATPADRRAYRLLDGVMLELWGSRSEALPGVFMRLFQKNPGDRVLRFLDERASLGDLVRLIFSLPFLPFLLAAARWLLRRMGVSRRRRDGPR